MSPFVVPLTAMPPSNAHRLNAAQHLRQTGTHWCTWSAAKVCAAWRARGGKYICPPGNMSMGCRLQRGVCAGELRRVNGQLKP